ncbi:sensor histidine kinase [Bradymonas sediminis]|uniref:sensor histidine kinase n=1 Tax=Bradymonas sediminis TaxID=1548548 RepID=UPI00105D08D2|nr:HAMP domain-containing sensor histidine kinase [Bradymonas sediminis]
MTSKPRNPFPGGLLVLGPDGRIVEAPAFFYEILELDHRSAPSIYHLFDPDDPPYMSFARVVRRANGVIEYHVAVNGCLGGIKGFRYWGLPAASASQRARASTFYITDESAVIQGYEWERRRVRREILHDVQTTVSEFLSQKLAGIRALAEVLRDVPDAAEETGVRIVMGLDGLRAALAKMGKTSMVNLFGPASDQPLRVLEMADILSVWSNGKVPIRCTVRYADEEAFIAASLLEGVLLPVVTNALEATLNNDPVRIDITQIDENMVEFRVKDSGPGLTRADRDRCEDPFFSTKSGHLGLGLTHASEILQRVGGEWSFDGSGMRGTTVVVRLPLTSGDHFLS